MKNTYWRQVAESRPLTALNREAVLHLRDDGTGILMKFRSWQVRGLRWNTMRHVDTRHPYRVRWRLLRHSASLGDALPEGPRARDSAVSVPQWGQAGWARWLWLATAILLLAFVAGGLSLTGVDGASAWSLSLWLSPLLFLFLPRLGPVRVRSLEQLPLDSRNVAEYAAQRIRGAHPEALEARPHRERVLARIAEIRAEYGALRLDVVERIDHPALFDGASPSTARLLAVLALADDADEDAPLEDLERLASRLEVAFEVARANARVVGIRHLPEDRQDDARRAAKAARLARESPNEGERRAARTQLNRILAQMGLHYMPSADEAPALEGRG